MSSNYNNASWFYQSLSQLVFGQAQVNAQTCYLNHIQPGSQVLIIGGGTGGILESLTKVHPWGLQITYVEISANMMALSRKRNTGKNKVVYITQDIQQVEFAQQFDTVITAFLFDNFSDENLAVVFPLIDAQVKPGGIWLNTDFQLTGALWQKIMLKSMYIFFRLFKAVEVMKLPHVKAVFSKYGYQVTREQTFYGDFIAARVWTKAT